jgi:hypothetical protein
MKPCRVLAGDKLVLSKQEVSANSLIYYPVSAFTLDDPLTSLMVCGCSTPGRKHFQSILVVSHLPAKSTFHHEISMGKDMDLATDILGPLAQSFKLGALTEI